MDGREYLAFSSKERKGIIVLLIILALVIVLPRFIGKGEYQLSPVEHNLLRHDSSGSGEERSVSTKQVIHQPDRLSNRGKPPSLNSPSARRYEKQLHYVRRQVKPVEINSADTSALIALPFIGSKLAGRIVLFRERLGGFVSVSQLKEVYGINDTAYQAIQPYLTCNSSLIHKLKINEALVDTLRMHPYIRWHLAKLLVNFRANHGSFKKIDDLLQIETVNDSLLQKLQPYISFD
jgi:DNA uptake protein ComE-like DNA-binding protein